MTLSERTIEALKRLQGFDLDLEPDEAKRLYALNIERLQQAITAAVEAEREECAKIAREAAECASRAYHSPQAIAFNIAHEIEARSNPATCATSAPQDGKKPA